MRLRTVQSIQKILRFVESSLTDTDDTGIERERHTCPHA
jgi:hypothetical protein